MAKQASYVRDLTAEHMLNRSDHSQFTSFPALAGLGLITFKQTA